MARDEERVREYAERTAAVLAGAGFPRMPARVLMALTVAETGLTAAELAERLDVSPAAISGAVRYLQTLAMVTRVPRPGSRRDLYEVHDSWYSASMAEMRVYDAVISLSEDIVGAAGGTSTAAGARIDDLARFFRFIQRRILEVLAEWVELNADREGEVAGGADDDAAAS